MFFVYFVLHNILLDFCDFSTHFWYYLGTVISLKLLNLTMSIICHASFSIREENYLFNYLCNGINFIVHQFFLFSREYMNHFVEQFETMNKNMTK